MIRPLSDELLLIEGSYSFLLIGRPGKRFSLCIEYQDGEICQTLDTSDLIVVSAPEGGDPAQARMLLELVRTYHAPLVVLPKDHPGSRRLKMVVSAGPVVQLHENIRRGTHPEQHLICASSEFDGMVLEGTEEGVRITGLPENAMVRVYPQRPG